MQGAEQAVPALLSTPQKHTLQIRPQVSIQSDRELLCNTAMYKRRFSMDQRCAAVTKWRENKIPGELSEEIFI